VYTDVPKWGAEERGNPRGGDSQASALQAGLHLRAFLGLKHSNYELLPSLIHMNYLRINPMSSVIRANRLDHRFEENGCQVIAKWTLTNTIHELYWSPRLAESLTIIHETPHLSVRKLTGLDRRPNRLQDNRVRISSSLY
jgi:hypothetical protein